MKRIFGKINLTMVELVLIASLIMIVVLIILEVTNATTFFKQGWHHLNIGNSLFYVIFGVLVGFLTLYGLLLTYRQLKLMEDRIDCYEDFYEAAIELLNDNSSKYVHFSGSTLVPGHISFGDKNYVSDDGKYFKALDNRIRVFFAKQRDNGKIGDEKKDLSKFILPQEYSEPYNKYKGKTYKNHGKGDDFHGTQEEINEKKEEMKTMQTRLGDYSLIKQIDSLSSSFLNNFYLSNGKTMIYAISITHEQANMIPDDGKVIEPVFVGFKTQKTSIIRAFEGRFNREWDNIIETPNL